ncbi:hypothetical protein B0E45_20990 [Sinorhizobium sp. A49]|nr:hypothetical protein B0E45_20990 [Sinorhizobium sp. A49]
MTIVRRCAPSPRFFFSALLAVAGFAEERPAAEKPRRQMLLESHRVLGQRRARRSICHRNPIPDRLWQSGQSAQ